MIPPFYVGPSAGFVAATVASGRARPAARPLLRFPRDGHPPGPAMTEWGRRFEFDDALAFFGGLVDVLGLARSRAMRTGGPDRSLPGGPVWAILGS